MPPVEERLELAGRTMTALVADAELPPKIGVHPRQPESFGHAMPALLRGPATDGSEDLLGIKWVVGFSGNREVGLPQIHATVLLSDPVTGLPRAILDGGPITAHRTAAVSGVAIRAWAPRPARPVRVAIVGAGVQARSHLPVLAHLLPGSSLAVHDRVFAAAATLAETARVSDAFDGVRIATDAVDAVDGADVVLTLVSFGPDRQAIPAGAFAPGALVVAVDYDMCVPASLASDAALFLVDERGQFLANRATGIFAGYPDPGATIGEALLHAMPRPAEGRVVVTHLGVGLADVVFADAILRTAEARGLGVDLGADAAAPASPAEIRPRATEAGTRPAATKEAGSQS